MTTDKVAAQYKEDNYSLMPKPADRIGQRQEDLLVVRELGVVNEKKVAPMANADEQSGNTTQSIEEDRCNSLSKGERAGRHRASRLCDYYMVKALEPALFRINIRQHMSAEG